MNRKEILTRRPWSSFCAINSHAHRVCAPTPSPTPSECVLLRGVWSSCCLLRTRLPAARQNHPKKVQLIVFAPLGRAWGIRQESDGCHTLPRDSRASVIEERTGKASPARMIAGTPLQLPGYGFDATAKASSERCFLFGRHLVRRRRLESGATEVLAASILRPQIRRRFLEPRASRCQSRL